MVIALVPARGGSVRVKNKNYKICGGKPLIAWTIEAAYAVNELDLVAVSSDSDKILSIASSFGAVTLLKRPAKLADDQASMVDVMLHVCDELGLVDEDILILLQPTSPLRKSHHISEALRAFKCANAESLVSVVKLPHIFHPSIVQKIENGVLLDILNRCTECSNEISGDVAYARNGPAILINKVSVIRRGKKFGESIVPFEMAWHESIDIDTPEDFNIANIFLTHPWI